MPLDEFPRATHGRPTSSTNDRDSIYTLNVYHVQRGHMDSVM